MKYLLLAIAVPDCFSMDGETMEINIKGMPQGEYKTAQVFKKESNELIKNGELVLQTDERPYGEWLEPFESNGKTYHKCTHCHISSELILFGNFCPNCGADMRKEGNR